MEKEVDDEMLKLNIDFIYVFPPLPLLDVILLVGENLNYIYLVLA